MLPCLEREEQCAAVAHHVVVEAIQHDGFCFIEAVKRRDVTAAQHLSHAAIKREAVSDRDAFQFAREPAEAFHVVEETREPRRALQVDRVCERMAACVGCALD